MVKKRLKPKEIAQKLKTYYKELEDIKKSFGTPTSKYAYKEISILSSWVDNVVGFLNNVGLKREASDITFEILKDYSLEFMLKWWKREGVEADKAEKVLEGALPKLKKLVEEIENYREDFLPQEQKEKTEGIKKNIPERKTKEEKTEIIYGDKIFIVHGHDKANLHELRDLLEKRYELQCTIMMWKPGRGRTLIEKFEQEAQNVGFAFILMTPDDLVKVAESEEEEYTQARPNVIFELGRFYGRLGRNRVCLIFKKGTKIHSDLEGISRIQFVDSLRDKTLEIEEELFAAGILGSKELR